MSTSPGDLFLGERVNPLSGDRTGERLIQPAHHFTTHGVIVGMTGSGKTGLGVVLLEEALLSGIPALILDPKGDMGNLLLNFPTLEADDFRPWVDEGEARREGIGVDELAARTARRWKTGLASWGIGPERMNALRESAEYTIFTPGSNAGVPLNLLGSLQAPDLDWSVHSETLRDEIEGLVSSLLTMAGEEANPLSSPAHILLSNIIEHVWRERRSLTLPGLIGMVQDPPIRKLGVFALDEFFPVKDRRDLAMRLNALVASPAFGSWMEGEPLDIASLLQGPGGLPRASVVSLAHLSDVERQSVVTLLLTRVITWMRQQPGTSDLRAMIYMDEMFGFAPPTAEPPSKKAILTIFKQARAHGLGMVVATQNPQDLDYKTMSNAGTWMVGRLQTERDKSRILEGLRSVSGAVDVKTLGAMIGGLRKREFVLRTTRSQGPALFTTRWAMSFLRGALTREEIIHLTRGRRRPDGGTAAGDSLASGQARQAQPTGEGSDPDMRAAEDETPLPPSVPDSVPQYFLAPGAPWAGEVGAVPGSRRHEPGLVARVRLRFDERYAEIDHTIEWEAVFFPLSERLDPEAAVHVDYDERDLRREGPERARFALSEAPLANAAFYRDAKRDLESHLLRHEEITVFRNPKLSLYSRVGEDRNAFLNRCRRVARDEADAETAKLRSRYEKELDRVEKALSRAESRVRELEVDVTSRKQQELVAGAGKLISLLLGGKASATTLSGVASRRSMTRRTAERLRTASEKFADQQAEIEELEEDLATEITQIVDEFETLAEAIESVEIGLEQDDVDVEEIAVVWIPRSRP